MNVNVGLLLDETIDFLRSSAYTDNTSLAISDKLRNRLHRKLLHIITAQIDSHITSPLIRDAKSRAND